LLRRGSPSEKTERNLLPPHPLQHTRGRGGGYNGGSCRWCGKGVGNTYGQKNGGGTGAYACAPPPSANPRPHCTHPQWDVQRKARRELAQLRRDCPDQRVPIQVAAGVAAREWADGQKNGGGTGAYACAPPPSANPRPPLHPSAVVRTAKSPPRACPAPSGSTRSASSHPGSCRWCGKGVGDTEGQKNGGGTGAYACAPPPSAPPLRPPAASVREGHVQVLERRELAQLRRDRPDQRVPIQVAAGGAAREWATQMVRRMAAAPEPTRAYRNHRRTLRPPLHPYTRGTYRVWSASSLPSSVGIDPISEFQFRLLRVVRQGSGQHRWSEEWRRHRGLRVRTATIGTRRRNARRRKSCGRGGAGIVCWL
jgi:hypothetical protein